MAIRNLTHYTTNFLLLLEFFIDEFLLKSKCILC